MHTSFLTLQKTDPNHYIIVEKQYFGGEKPITVRPITSPFPSSEKIARIEKCALNLPFVVENMLVVTVGSISKEGFSAVILTSKNEVVSTGNIFSSLDFTLDTAKAYAEKHAFTFIAPETTSKSKRPNSA